MATATRKRNLEKIAQPVFSPPSKRLRTNAPKNDTEPEMPPPPAKTAARGRTKKPPVVKQVQAQTKRRSRASESNDASRSEASTLEFQLPEISEGDLTSTKNGKQLKVEGGQATVYLHYLYFGTPVAVKYFAIDPEESREAETNREAFEKECRFLARIRHQNLALAMGVNLGKGLIVMQRYDMDLESFILDAADESERFEDRKVLDTLVMGIARGLAYLHDVMHIVHRDLKPENILMEGNSPKISDFGLSKELFQSKTATPRIGTAEFMAPEILGGTHQYSYEVDVYSFGLLVYYCLEFLYPWDDVYSKKGRTIPGMKAIFAKNSEERPQFTSKSKGSPYSQYCSLAERCWVTEPEDRPKMAEIVQEVAEIMKI